MTDDFVHRLAVRAAIEKVLHCNSEGCARQRASERDAAVHPGSRLALYERLGRHPPGHVEAQVASALAKTSSSHSAPANSKCVASVAYRSQRGRGIARSVETRLNSLGESDAQRHTVSSFPISARERGVHVKIRAPARSGFNGAT